MGTPLMPLAKVLDAATQGKQIIIGMLIVGLIFVLKRRRKDKDNYAEVKADLKRFEEMIKAQEGGAAIPTSVPDDPAVAIRAAIKQAKRAGDEKTAAKLESRLEALLERQAAIPSPVRDEVLPTKTTKIRHREKVAGSREQEAAPSPPPSAPTPAPTSPAPAAAASIPQPASVAAKAPEPENGNGNGSSDGNGHGREDDAALVAILRVLAEAPPGGERFSLIKAARQYGRDAIEAHPEELAALPSDVRVRLLRAAPQQPEPAPAAPSEIA